MRLRFCFVLNVGYMASQGMPCAPCQNPKSLKVLSHNNKPFFDPECPQIFLTLKWYRTGIYTVELLPFCNLHQLLLELKDTFLQLFAYIGGVETLIFIYFILNIVFIEFYIRLTGCLRMTNLSQFCSLFLKTMPIIPIENNLKDIV